MSVYYTDKLAVLADLFGAPVELHETSIRVGPGVYPIVDDVIVLLPSHHWPPSVKSRINGEVLTPRGDQAGEARFSEVVQAGFGSEWETFADILPEEAAEFESYFDLVDLKSLKDRRVCDLGCGNGRWASFVAPYCRELVLIDFSEAIFVARHNLRDDKRALFFMGDVTALPFRRDCADLMFCLGVLHHLPTPALDAVAALEPYAPQLLIYLYYALDNRPTYFRALLAAVTSVRRVLSRVQNRGVRGLVAFGIAVGVYEPLVILGHLLEVVGRGRMVPLFEAYRGKSLRRIRQDAYDRFFTSIEQRVSQDQILRSLSSRFGSVVISKRPPYWHFLCTRA